MPLVDVKVITYWIPSDYLTNSDIPGSHMKSLLFEQTLKIYNATCLVNMDHQYRYVLLLSKKKVQTSFLQYNILKNPLT
ncbi:hypothetical protein NPIL_388961 [Nephila pilipes]|uniref:Uncharacterized protein n=1 Tax=Nephila pilipes TaxID=299642 RepID=A0A8X6K9B5_NEPPI|nr:hypothetical protein NPIL_388961 [Nephila pilipes]